MLDSVLLLGAHADDIEVGASGTILELARSHPTVRFHFLIATADPERDLEAKESACNLLPGRIDVEVGGFTDGSLPYEDPAGVKKWLRSRELPPPDLVFAPCREDSHQDHRFIGELAWQLYRRTTILEYEIPKWDEDPFTANFYVPLGSETVERKVRHLMDHFTSQHSKDWYTPDLFEAILRLRGIESGTSHAEAFHARKLVLSDLKRWLGSSPGDH